MEVAMVWDTKTPSIVTQAKLSLLPAEQVYAKLGEYAEYLLAHRFSQSEELEKALLRRDDPLINLGLAQYGGCREVVLSIYASAFDGEQDAVQNRALRLAVLGNRVLPKSSFRTYTPEDSEVRRIALSGDDDEVDVLVNNPSARGLLVALYNGKPPLHDLPDERLVKMVRWSTRNAAITLREDSEHGPDMEAWDLQKGIWRLVKTVPVTESWVVTLHDLLNTIDPSQARTPDEDPRPVFARWQAFKANEEFTKRYGEYWAYSDLPLNEDLCCLMAALYGRTYIDSKWTQLGSLDDQNVLMRYAFYGHGKMSPEQMESAHNRDGLAFTYAALCNSQLFLGEPRVKLEKFIAGPLMIRRYRQRCLQLEARGRINAKPVSEWGEGVLEDMVEKPSAEMVRIKELEGAVTTLGKNLRSMSSMLFVTMIVVIVILLRLWKW